MWPRYENVHIALVGTQIEADHPIYTGSNAYASIPACLSRLRFFPPLSRQVVLFASRFSLRRSLSTNRRPSYWFHKRNLDRCFLILPWNQLFQLSPVGAGIFRARFKLIPLARRLSIPRAVICIQMRRSSSRDYARRRGLLILKLLSGLELLILFLASFSVLHLSRKPIFLAVFTNINSCA